MWGSSGRVFFFRLRGGDLNGKRFAVSTAPVRVRAEEKAIEKLEKMEKEDTTHSAPL